MLPAPPAPIAPPAVQATRVRSAARLLLAVLAVTAAAPPARAEGSAVESPVSPIERCLRSAEEAQDARARGAFAAARARLLVCAADACPREVRADCTRWLDELERAQPRVSVAVVDERGGDVLGAEVALDGVVIAYEAGRTLAVDPGPHDLVVAKHGFVAARVPLVVREGEAQRVVRVALRAVAEAPERVPPAARARSALPLVLLGAGGAVLIGAVVAGATTKARYDDLASTCAPSCPRSETDGLRTRAIVVDVVGLAGLVALGLGGVLTLQSAGTP